MLPGERKKNKICRDSAYHWPQINKRLSATAFKAKYFPVQKEVITMSSQDGGIDGLTVTTPTGEQYFIMGKNRVKITEHFPTDGKQLDELIADLVIQKIKENAGKSA